MSFVTALTLLLSISLTAFSVFGKFTFDTRREPVAAWGWALASVFPGLVAGLILSTFPEVSVQARNLILGGLGAVAGLCLSIWLGYLVAGTPPARGPTPPTSLEATPPNPSSGSVVNQGPGSGYSVGQSGGVTIGTVESNKKD